MLRRTLALATPAFVLSMLAATDVAATAQRTFVASTGNDANPCSLVLPCRTFGAAITHTNSSGEVIVLDSAGYGPVTISQSVSIIAPGGVYAGISVPAGVGVHINAAGINVVLRGLSINSNGGTHGIRMTNGDELMVDNCVISNFSVNAGITIETSATVKISNSVLHDNSEGIVAGYGATVNVNDSQVIRSVDVGIVIATFVGTSGTTNIFIADTLVTGTGIAGNTICIVNGAPSGATGHISATRVTVTGCGEAAFENSPLGVGSTTVSNSMVTGNAVGFLQTSGAFRSLGNNDVHGNPSDTLGTITTILPI